MNFDHGDRVRIIAGRHKGDTGTVICDNPIPGMCAVLLDFSLSVIDVAERDLEAIVLLGTTK